MAETPEHLSDIAAEEAQQDKRAASPHQTAGSDAERSSSGRRRHRAHEEQASQHSSGRPDAAAASVSGQTQAFLSGIPLCIQYSWFRLACDQTAWRQCIAPVCTSGGLLSLASMHLE